jgi:lysophospholipase L1-like esterase
MRTRTRIALVLAAPLAGLLLAEAVVRVFDIGPIPAPGQEGDIARACDDPELRVENIPGGWMKTLYFDRSHTVVKSVEARVNGQGFRGPELPLAKEPGTFRIACLGDSQTFGHGVGEGESWPANLEACLEEHLPGRKIEVLNAGVGGYETEEELALFEKRVRRYRPDLVLLGFFLNDTAVKGARIESIDSSLSKWVRLLAPGQKQGFLPWLRRSSRTVDLACDWQFRRLTLSRWVEQRAPLYAPDFEGWIRVQAAMRRFDELQKQDGGRFAVVLVPLLMREGKSLLSSEPYKVVADYLRAAAIPCFDPEPEFADVSDVDALRVHERDLHSNPEAQRRIGRGVARWLLEQHLVP